MADLLFGLDLTKQVKLSCYTWVWSLQLTCHRVASNINQVSSCWFHKSKAAESKQNKQEVSYTVVRPLKVFSTLSIREQISWVGRDAVVYTKSEHAPVHAVTCSRFNQTGFLFSEGWTSADKCRLFYISEHFYSGLAFNHRNSSDWSLHKNVKNYC